MNILLINTALDLSFIALINERKNIVKTFPFKNTNEDLLPGIDVLLRKQKINLDKIDAISVCVGPGSFTGIRVGIATAKAFSIARGIPLISFNAFDLFPKNKMCLTKANSGGAYTKKNKEICFIDKNVVSGLTDKEILIFEEENDYFPNFTNLKRISLINQSVSLSIKLFNENKFCKVNELIPLYVQKSQAENELISNIKNSKIVLAKKDDAKRLAEIEKECFLKPYSETLIQNEIKNKSKKIFCLKFKDKIIGYALFSLLGEECELERVCIIKKFRALGLGEMLIKKCFSKIGAKKCFLEVNKKNEIAIKLYIKLGFIKTGERKNYYGENEDAVLMTIEF